MTLRKPPSKARAGAAGRLVVLVILVVLAGVTVWAAVTNQRPELLERTRHRDLELADAVDVGDLTVNLVIDREADPMVVLLHDADVAGGIIWNGLAEELPDDFGVARIDLPGFGLSSRIPDPGPSHTVAGMSDVVAEVLTARFAGPVIVAGVGLGGEVGAELAVDHPSLVSGVILIDTDFWGQPDLVETVGAIPWLGRAVTHAFETGGRFSLGRLAPYCDRGGWCPDSVEIEVRVLAESIEGTTDSVHAFRRTPSASQVPSRLDRITVPVVFIHSTNGPVPASSIERFLEEIPTAEVVEVDAYQAHLERPGEVAAAIVGSDG